MKLSITIQTPEVPKTVPVALCTGTLDEKLTRLAGWGADGVELLTTHPEQLDPHLFSARLTSMGLKTAAIASGGMGFALGMTLLHAEPEMAEAARQKLHHLIAFAAALHAPVVTVGSFRGRLASVPGQDGRRILTQILREAAAIAHDRSVRLALEPLNRYETDVIFNVEQGLEFVAEINHPALGLLLDTYHVNIEEASWTVPFRKAMAAGRLFHVHLGDNNRLPPGKGLIDFLAIVATLREAGYSGYLSAELLGKPDPDTAARQTLSYMRKIIKD